MTRDGVISQIHDALETAPKTASRTLLQALRDARKFIEDHPEIEFTVEMPTVASTGGIKLLAEQCAAELEEAINLKVGVMDSENRVKAVEGQRLGAMQSVAARLREYA